MQVLAFERQTSGARNSVMHHIMEFRSEELSKKAGRMSQSGLVPSSRPRSGLHLYGGEASVQQGVFQEGVGASQGRTNRVHLGNDRLDLLVESGVLLLG